MEEPIISTENKSNGEVVQSQPQPQSQPQALIEAKPPKDKRRHFLAAFFLSFFWGAFGVDRFYLGKVFTGILKLLTFGGLGIWTAIDIALIMSGAMRDRQGNELIDAKRYKKFARVTVSVFTFLVLAIIVATVYFSYIAIVQIMQSGVFQQYLNAGGNIQQMMTGGALNLNGVDLTQMTNGATNLNGLDIQQMLDLVKNASGQQSN